MKTLMIVILASTIPWALAGILWLRLRVSILKGGGFYLDVIAGRRFWSKMNALSRGDFLEKIVNGSGAFNPHRESHVLEMSEHKAWQIVSMFESMGLVRVVVRSQASVAINEEKMPLGLFPDFWEVIKWDERFRLKKKLAESDRVMDASDIVRKVDSCPDVKTEELTIERVAKYLRVLGEISIFIVEAEEDRSRDASNE